MFIEAGELTQMKQYPFFLNFLR